MTQLRESLKRLHRAAGDPSTRSLARKIGTLSHTTVHGVLRCEKVPVWGQLELVVESLDGGIDEFLALWVAAKDEQDARATAPPAQTLQTAQGSESEDGAYDVIIVSCDIVGHSSETSHRVQRRRVADINTIVARSIADHGPHRVIWLSGGDGGHVVFRDISVNEPWWRVAVIELVGRLADWSAEEGRRLRVTGHAGEATDMPGADGRIQIVGDGINVAGWLLTRGGPEGVVVTDPFREWIENDGPLDSIIFHEPRLLRDKKRVDQRLMLMSFDGHESHWYRPVNEDREQLRKALERMDDPANATVPGPQRHGWEVILYAKRILQFNKDDPEARQALGRLNRLDLQCRTDEGRVGLNPFFEDLDATLLREVVESAELVYRGYNEVICRTGDAGDTMFVILRGRVGVYKRSTDRSGDGPIEPDYSHEEGEVVGELAFALAGNRTAEMVALTDTLLLAFNYNQIVKLLPGDGIGAQVKARVSRFITHRVLQHVSERVPFLVGPHGIGPLAKGVEPVRQTVAKLSWYCELLTLDRNQPVTLEAAGGDDGIYLLAAGSLKSESDHARMLSADAFPVLWAVLPDLPGRQAPRFLANSNQIKVLRIEAAGLEQLDLEKLQGIKSQLASSATA